MSQIILVVNSHCLLRTRSSEHLGGSAVEHLPLAQVVIPGSRDGVPHLVPCMEPVSPSAYVSASLSVSPMNKIKSFLKSFIGDPWVA